ncbi:MAG: OmpA family protein [Lachnospiraceae bacterium]|nr:OmpA family protein [Lachnospiraceae bacterium]
MDEEAAKAAVEPVAEALLSHPDNAILIAGTTATDGTQESCVELSERRANAVKDLLVNEFGIPESQIQTIGLGYEADPFERRQDREIEGDITSKFIESEGKKNRRVVIMDLASDIAQQILADNS